MFCKIVAFKDVSEMTSSGYIPPQRDDIAVGSPIVYNVVDRKTVAKLVRKVWPDEEVRVYILFPNRFLDTNFQRVPLIDEGKDGETPDLLCKKFILIPPEDEPDKKMSVSLICEMWWVDWHNVDV